MLPPGASAQPVAPAEGAGFRALLPAAQTVARLLVGGCSCDLVRPRDPDRRVDERHLRDRYFRAKLSRDRIIRELERHRRGHPEGDPGDGPDWRAALSAFVAEHARNAGATLYGLRFGPADPPPALHLLAPVIRTVAEVRAHPGDWLGEESPTLVVG